ncbi:VIT1/CCC1 transporter family protein [Paludibacterium denitrificans]|uniref:VIT1/CCC1 transporter family protein n=1 Tax=Paludibacterium denitrificans TaxID=2675226 RepID=UPI002477E14D|nr:VIT1/CCC1 transporter family protein [Paludibacterium denitrificans]
MPDHGGGWRQHVAFGPAHRRAGLSTLAGACSMAMGEWISVQSSRELMEQQIAAEAEELVNAPHEEKEELALIYQAKGFSAEEADTIASRVMQDSHSSLDTLVREELGINPDDLGGSARAGGGLVICGVSARCADSGATGISGGATTYRVGQHDCGQQRAVFTRRADHRVHRPPPAAVRTAPVAYRPPGGERHLRHRPVVWRHDRRLMRYHGNNPFPFR